MTFLYWLFSRRFEIQLAAFNTGDLWIKCWDFFTSCRGKEPWKSLFGLGKSYSSYNSGVIWCSYCYQYTELQFITAKNSGHFCLWENLSLQLCSWRNTKFSVRVYLQNIYVKMNIKHLDGYNHRNNYVWVFLLSCYEKICLFVTKISSLALTWEFHRGCSHSYTSISNIINDTQNINISSGMRKFFYFTTWLVIFYWYNWSTIIK